MTDSIFLDISEIKKQPKNISKLIELPGIKLTIDKDNLSDDIDLLCLILKSLPKKSENNYQSLASLSIFSKIVQKSKKLNSNKLNFTLAETITKEIDKLDLNNYWARYKIITDVEYISKIAEPDQGRIIRKDLTSKVNFLAYKDARRALKIILELANSSEDFLDIIEQVPKIIKEEDFKYIIKNVKFGIKNNRIRKIKPRLNQILCGFYDFDNLGNNKIKLLRYITKNPKYMRYVNKFVKFNLNEISQLGPASRLRFLDFFYHNIKSSKIGQVSLDNISMSKIKELLFPVAIKNPEKVERFLSFYKMYSRYNKSKSIYDSRDKRSVY